MAVECPAAEFAQLRAEARRDLKAMLAPSAAAGLLVVGVTVARGTGALWPVWGAIAAAFAVLVAIGVWASFFRGWRVLRRAGGS